MKNIIFFFFLFYSNLTFSLTYSSHPEFPEDSLPCTYFVPSPCQKLGWYSQKITFTYGEVGSPLYDDYYPIISETSPLPDFPQGCFIQDLNLNHYSDFSIVAHPVCVADDLANWRCVERGSDYCGDCYYDAAHSRDHLVICSSGVSQKTAIEKNDLISESNSKFGSISSSNSTSTNIFSGILDTLRGFLSQNFGVFGTGANSSDPSNKDNPDSPEFEPTFLTNSVDVTQISPLMTGDGSYCPSDISFTVLDSTHHLSYQPLCDFTQKLRPLVVNAARVAAAWILIGAL